MHVNRKKELSPELEMGCYLSSTEVLIWGEELLLGIQYLKTLQPGEPILVYYKIY